MGNTKKSKSDLYSGGSGPATEPANTHGGQNIKKIPRAAPAAVAEEV